MDEFQQIVALFLKKIGVDDNKEFVITYTYIAKEIYFSLNLITLILMWVSFIAFILHATGIIEFELIWQFIIAGIASITIRVCSKRISLDLLKSIIS